MRKLSISSKTIKSFPSSEIWTKEDIKKLSLLKRFILKTRGYVFLRHEKKEGWNGYLPIYLVHCKVHDIYFEDYPHGHSKRFDCPLCLKEEEGFS